MPKKSGKSNIVKQAEAIIHGRANTFDERMDRGIYEIMNPRSNLKPGIMSEEDWQNISQGDAASSGCAS